MPALGEYSEANQVFLNEMLLKMPGVVAGKMFGHPGWKINGKVFAMLVGDSVVVKVGADAAPNILAEDFASEFKPRGNKPWADWVVLSRETPEDYAQDEDLFIKAVEFTSVP